MIHASVVDAIGHTPLVRLDLPGQAYAKLEMLNLFAMKDRVARNILLSARERGDLAEGAPVVESSSGTMALGLALVGRSLGHPVHIVTDPRIDPVTAAKLRALGCVLHVVEEMDEQGWQGARLRRLAEVMADHPGAFWPRQYSNPDNPAAYRTLAGELVADLGSVDVLVGAVGSGGSLCGTARELRRTCPDLRVVGVDCAGSVLFGQPDHPRRLQSGLGNSLHPRNLDLSVIDEVHWLSDAEAFTSTLELAGEQGLFAGNTSGSVYRVVREVARRAGEGTRVVGVFPDRGDRYVNTVYDEDHWAAHGLTPDPYGSGGPRRAARGEVVRSWSYGTGPDEGRVMAFVESNTTGTGVLALGRATALGLRPVLVTSSPERYGDLGRTGCEVITCDTNDDRALRSAVLDRFRPAEFAGVMSTSDFYVHAASLLAAELGLTGNSVEAVRACRDKAALRALSNEGAARPVRSILVTDANDLTPALVEVGLPCVLKPVDDSGSSEVRLCRSKEEASAHAPGLLARTRNGRGQASPGAVLVEEYLEGPEYSVEVFSVDGEHRIVGVTEKTLTGAPCFVEVRHVHPAPVADRVREALEAEAVRVLDAAGVTTGATHTEVRLTAEGPAVVEVNLRLAGGMIPELVRAATGVDLVEQQVRAFAGLPVDLESERSGTAGIQFLTADRAGVLSAVEGVEAARSVPGVDRVTVTAEAGRRVRPPADAYDRVGHVIAVGDGRKGVVDALEEAVARTDVRVTRDGDSEMPEEGTRT